MSVKISGLPAVEELPDDALLMGEGAKATSQITVANFKKQFVGAASSSYNRDALPAPSQTRITISPTTVKIGDEMYASTSDTALNLASSTAWDSSTYATASERAGKDFYVYACVPSSGSEPKFLLSANSTVPTGYAANTSRKIGGFHCLCLSVGTITDHPLSGYLTGDILPASVWDLRHRCRGENEGMVYDEYDDIWLSIYLLSYDNGKTVSVYGGTILTGTTNIKTHSIWYTETLAKQKMRLPYMHEFFTAFKGCQECVNITGSADPVTAGGHTYTNGVRCISNIGLEDPTGVVAQWCNNYCGAGGSGNTTSTYNSNVDSVNRGSAYGTLYCPLAGASWDNSKHAGSRAVDAYSNAVCITAQRAGRSASEPRFVRL